jgi:hypothetical protein
MKYSIAIAGFVASFMMAVLSIGAIGLVVSFFVWIRYEEKIPVAYWPIVWIVAGVIAIAAGIHSFRATLRRHQKQKS